jgi:hypothetical protein
MTLTKQRRNEIAWLCVIKLAESRPIRSIKDTVEELSVSLHIYSDDPRFRDVTLRDFVTAVYREVLQRSLGNLVHMGCSNISYASLNEISWILLVKRMCKDGMKIGNITRREVGNEASRIKISTDEMLEFYKLLATEVFNRAFSK